MSTATAVRPTHLSRQLRASTRVEHVRAEAAFAIHERTADRASYGELLTALRSFYGPAEARLRLGMEWDQLSPRVDVRARERAHLLTSDLRQLGVDVSASAPGCPAQAEPLTTGLGWLYVLEGSRLGGAFIARGARAALGDDLPVAFFSGDDRPPGTDWRALQQALDRFGVTANPGRCAEVVAAARLAFAAFVECLSPHEARR